jgi:hypothetical protein
MARRTLMLLLAVAWIPLAAGATETTLTSLVLQDSPTSGLEVFYDEILTEEVFAEMGVDVDMAGVDVAEVDGHMRAWGDADRTIALLLIDGLRLDPSFSVGFLRGISSSIEDTGAELVEWPEVTYTHVASALGPESFSASAGENGFGIHVLALGPRAEAMAKSTLIAQIARLPDRIDSQDAVNSSRSAEFVGRAVFYVLLVLAIWFVIKRRRRAKTSAAGDNPRPMDLL